MKMGKYIIEGMVTVSVYTTVEADDEEEAKEIANDRPIEHNNWQDNQSDDVWVSDEYDGEVTITGISIEEDE